MSRPPKLLLDLQRHSDWPLLLELARELQLSRGRRITKIAIGLAQRAAGKGKPDSKTSRLLKDYRKYKKEIEAALRDQMRRERERASTTALLQRLTDRESKIKQAVEAALTDRILRSNPSYQALKRLQEKLDRVAKALDPLAEWRHLLDGDG
jgi:molybdenum-dependent DNA-binding transcriptional regulator ModE